MVNEELIKKAREFHGHLCPFLVLGLRISEIGMEKLNVKSSKERRTLGEDLLAIVEVNNCIVDGIQVATGCTLGNNSLIYLDTGKNVVTFVRRDSWRGVRIYIDSERIVSKYFPEEANELFDKVVKRREGTLEDQERLSRLWEELAYLMAEIPEEEFKIEEVTVEEIERAPIFESVRCSKCNELVMKPKAVEINGSFYCPMCADKELSAVIGRGIVHGIHYPVKEV